MKQIEMDACEAVIRMADTLEDICKELHKKNELLEALVKTLSKGRDVSSTY